MLWSFLCSLAQTSLGSHKANKSFPRNPLPFLHTPLPVPGKSVCLVFATALFVQSAKSF